MDGSVLEEKTSFKMLGLTFSSKLHWGSYIVSITKTASKKIGALIRSMKFLSPEVALYLYKSTIRPCMEYCCLVWAGAPSCYLELLDKLQKRICRTVGLYLSLKFGISEKKMFLGLGAMCMYVCMDGWMDGWMDGCMYVCMYVCLCLSVCMYV